MIGHQVGGTRLARSNVNAICPGFMETDMFSDVPEEVRGR